MNSLFLELSKQRSLLKMMEEKGFTLCQQNGQRTYGGPPPNWGSRAPPSRDCEVFIGRLPRMCFEDELIPLFLTAGELYEFRLMLDFSGTNRGYGYAHYATPAGAQRAIEKLNNYEIRPGHQIGVLKSKNNCRLLIGNIKAATDKVTFDEFIQMATDSVLNVFMFRNFQQLKETDFSVSSEVEEAFLSRVPRSGGDSHFAIVEYENHKAAAVARRVLIPKYGHVLAIDWAVPPRENTRFISGAESNVQTINKPLKNCTAKKLNSLTVLSPFWTARPVPTLLVHPSYLDDVSFMPKNFKNVIKFFKYQLTICLYKSLDYSLIPVCISNKMEKKIINRITNLENCGQAVQLIFNYFSWYNEKKKLTINSEVQEMLHEVKLYTESFISFINKKINFGSSFNSYEDTYYLHILPLQLNILFRIILRTDRESKDQIKLYGGITAGLNFLKGIMQKDDKASKDLIEEAIILIQNEDESSLDRAIELSKALLWNTITSQKEMQANMKMELFVNSEMQPIEEVKEQREIINYQLSNDKSFLEKVRVGENRSLLFSDSRKLRSAYPNVPLLFIQRSITNKAPFMPEIFRTVLTYFKYVIRICLSVSASQMKIPQKICIDIEWKIIDRISNVENCSHGVQLILDYLSRWVEKRPSYENLEVQRILLELKVYSDALVNFMRIKTSTVYARDEPWDIYFSKVLPLRLSLLFHMILIFNTESPMRFLIPISKGLKWLGELFQREDESAKQFLEDLTRFIVDLNPVAFERAQNLGKRFCVEMMTSVGQAINHHADIYSNPRSRFGIFLTERP